MTSTSFANPSHDSSRVFRQMLDAVAHPGRVYHFSSDITPPIGLSRELAAVALTLCDYQTPVWLSSSLKTPENERYLRFYTGAPLTAELSEAAFAFAIADQDLPDLSRLPKGSHEYPDRSATLVIEVSSLLEGQGLAELNGPGIVTKCVLDAPPLGAVFWADFMEQHEEYPLGVDMILVAPNAISAVPRSTEIAIRMRI